MLIDFGTKLVRSEVKRSIGIIEFIEAQSLGKLEFTYTSLGLFPG